MTKKVLSIILATVMLLATASFTVSATAEGVTNVFTENFDGAGMAAGNIDGQNGWELVQSGGNYVDDSDMLIAQHDGSNSLLIKRTATPGSTSANTYIQKSFDSALDSGIIKFSFKVKPNANTKTNDADTIFALIVNESTALSFKINHQRSKLTAVPAGLTNNKYLAANLTDDKTAQELGVWHSYNILLDIDNGNCEFYCDDYLVTSGTIDTEIETIDGLRITFSRAKGNNGTEVYVDDITANAYTAAGILNEALGTAGLADKQKIYSSDPLPTSTLLGNTITWVSSDPAVISNKGVVTRQTTDRNVTLTASVTIGDVTATKTFSITVTNKNAYLIEDFENPSLADGTSVHSGFNGWVFTQASATATRYQDSTYSIKTKNDSKMLSMYRQYGNGYNSTVYTAGAANATFTKDFDAVSDGTVSVSFDVIRNDAANYLNVYLGSYQFTLYFQDGTTNRIGLTHSGGASGTMHSKLLPTAVADISHNIKIELDLDRNLYSYFVDGERVFFKNGGAFEGARTLKALDDKTINKLNIHVHRTNSIEAGAEFFIDNIRVERPYGSMKVTGSTITAITDTNDAKLSSVSLTSDVDNLTAYVIVALYDARGNLSSAAMHPIGEDGTFDADTSKDIQTDITIEKGNSIKVIALSSFGSLVPLMSAYEYIN